MTQAAKAADVLFTLKEEAQVVPAPLARNKQERLLQLSSMHCRLLQHELNEVRWFKLHRKDYELSGDFEYIETAVSEQRAKIARIEAESDELKVARDALSAMLDELIDQLNTLKQS